MPPGHPGYPGQQQFPGAMQTGGANPFMMPPTGQVIQTNTFLAGSTGMADPTNGASGLLLPGPQNNAQAQTNRGLAPAQPGAPSASNPFAQAMVTGGLDDLSVGALGIIPGKKQPGPQPPMRAMGGMTGGSMGAMGGMTGGSMGSGPHAGPSGGGNFMGGDPAQSGLLMPPGAQSAPSFPPAGANSAGYFPPAAAPSGMSTAATGGSASSGGAPVGGASAAFPNAFMQQPQHANYAQVPPTGATGQQQFMPHQPQFQGSVTGFNNLPQQGHQPYFGGGFPGQAPNAQFYGGVTGPPAYGGAGGYGMQYGYRPPAPQMPQGFPGQSGQFGGPPQGQQYHASATGQPFGAPQHQMGQFHSSTSGPAAPQAMAAPWSNAFQ